MTIELSQKELLAAACDLLVVYAFQGVARPVGAASFFDKALDGAISTLIEQDGFEGKFGQTIVFPTFGRIEAKNVAVLGLGEKKSFDTDAVRKAGAHIVKIAERAHATTVATLLPGETQAFVEGALLSDYRFHAFHGVRRNGEKKPKRVATLLICGEEVRNHKRVQEGIEMARVFAEATWYARDLVNTPSSHMTPAHLAEEARKLAGNGVRVHVMDAKEMERRKMHAALAVGQGSVHAPVGVHLSYTPRGAKKNIAVVGKAVTFDSGGLSLKPADSMMTMKIDMAGAAVVLGLFKALATLKLNVEVHGVFLAVENMPGGTAYRPGDVVTAMNGMTIEVLNTDAEGRITLADALSYAASLKPDAIIDLATLTGACVVALGEEIAGLLSPHEKLAEKLLASARDAGEGLWRLPLFLPYAEHIKSKIADLKNVGAHGGGTITAALFLQPFVGEIPWAHLDIAGPSYIERETQPDQPYGASGYGVRLLLSYLRRI